MMRRPLLISLFILIATPTLAAPPPVNPADALAFMQQLWNRAAELLNDKTDPAIRRARFRQLFHEDFDGTGIARFALGRYWRSASEQEQREFVKLFEDYVVYAYTARLVFGLYPALLPVERPVAMCKCHAASETYVNSGGFGDCECIPERLPPGYKENKGRVGVRTIVIRIPRLEFSAEMAAMRKWLAKHRCEPLKFTSHRYANLVSVYVQFENNSEADAFKARFKVHEGQPESDTLPLLQNEYQWSLGFSL